MARGIIELIKENKKRFYRGEIRNYFYEEPLLSGEKKKNPVIITSSTTPPIQASYWENLILLGRRFKEELFYEPVK